ncbi:MAG TPA: hypothetical protein VLC46_06665 [Thermoanaerobaculia bacterium]|jgi:hypothetical protein|nr:hypothetical protein [Thermoanaerobaculia bacterium]
MQRIEWTRWRTTTEVAKNLVEAVGLLIAGLWVLLTFGLQSCPAREKQFDSVDKLTWTEGPTPQTCVANYYVMLKNISSRTMRIGRADVRLFRVVPSTPNEMRPAFLNADASRPKRKEDYMFYQTLLPPTGAFVDLYPPNGSNDTTFRWIFTKPKTPTWIAAEVWFFEPGAKQLIWEVSEVSQVCEGNPIGVSSSAPTQ